MIITKISLILWLGFNRGLYGSIHYLYSIHAFHPQIANDLIQIADIEDIRPKLMSDEVNKAIFFYIKINIFIKNGVYNIEFSDVNKNVWKIMVSCIWSNEFREIEKWMRRSGTNYYLKFLCKLFF